MTARRKSESTPVVSSVAKHSFSLISEKKLLALYQAMLECRLIEVRSRLDFDRETYAAIGQEAALAGVLFDVQAYDFIATSRLRLLRRVMQGEAPVPILNKIFAHQAARDKAPSLQPSHAQLNQAIGVALTHKARGNGRIAVVFSGSGKSSIAWQEALYVAGTHELPMVFVAQNPAKTTAKPEQITSDTPVDGLPAIPVESSDVVAVYRVATESITRAREGHGPTLIDCIPFSLDVADPGQVTDDSILNMEQYLRRKGIFSQSWKDEYTASYGRQLEAAVALA